MLLVGTMGVPGAAQTAPALAETLFGGIDMADRICSVEDCHKRAVARGWCPMHWSRWRKYGDPLTVRVVQFHGLSDEDRFFAHVASKSGPVPERRPDLGPCWVWNGRPNNSGYARFWFAGRRGMAHQYAYEQFIGPLPAGTVPDHLCRNRMCPNPAHLEAVTPGENSLRGESFAAVNAAKALCDYGHPLMGANLRIGKKGDRVCRSCVARRQREYQARRKAAP